MLEITVSRRERIDQKAWPAALENRTMRSIRARLERLERQQPTKGQLTFEETLDRYLTLHSWLQERGYADALAAVEAGESGPVGLENLLREQAGSDHKHRAFARIEKALAAGQPPDDADLRAVQARQGPAQS